MILKMPNVSVYQAYQYIKVNARNLPGSTSTTPQRRAPIHRDEELPHKSGTEAEVCWGAWCVWTVLERAGVF